MPKSALGQKLFHLALLPDSAVSDRELIEQFLSTGDEASFEVLIRRHGPMVLGICRRMLRDEHLAEDAFQATFLILVRKAAAIHKRESMVSWLHGVAFRIALKARGSVSRRRSKERPLGDLPGPEPLEASWLEIRQVLDEELARLSEIYRAPIILCDLERKTRKEAAQLVGCPEGTLSTRLMRARAQLAQRLRRRGVELSAIVPGAIFANQELAVLVPPTLRAATRRAAAAVALGQAATAISPPVAALVKGTLAAMLWTVIMKRTFLVTAIVLLCGLALPSIRKSFSATPVAVDEGSQPAPTQPKQSTPDDAPMRAALSKTVDLVKGIDPMPLSEALENLQDLFGVTITLDAKRFAAAGDAGVQAKKVSLPAMFHVSLAAVLRMIAKQVNGICLTAPDKIVLVPNHDKINKGLLAKGHKLFPEGPAEEESLYKMLGLVTQSYYDSTRALRSGSGTGTYELYRWDPSLTKSVLKTKAAFTLRFDHKRYYLALQYEKDEMGAIRRIIICDNSAVYSSEFKRQESVGEVGELAGFAPAGFLWDPSRLAVRPIDPSSWLHFSGEPAVEKLGEDGCVIRTVPEKGVSNSFTALKQFDWNITDWKFEVQGRQSPAQQTRLTWKKKGNVWYVASIEETRGFAPQQARQVLRFDEFEPNVKIPSKLFHLSALELPVGAAICDRREQGHDWRRYRSFQTKTPTSSLTWKPSLKACHRDIGGRVSLIVEAAKQLLDQGNENGSDTMRSRMA